MYFVLKLWPSLCLDPLRQIELSLYDLLFIVSQLMFFFYCQRGNNSAIPYRGKIRLYWLQGFFCNMYSPGWVPLGQITFFKKAIQAFLNFRGLDFRNFRFTAVYISILFSSPLVLLSNLGTQFLLLRFLCVPTLRA